MILLNNVWRFFVATFLFFSFPALAFVTFSDVSADHRNHDAILWLQENGIVEGYAGGTFRPNNAVNRAEALKMILEGLHIDVLESSRKPFFDVPRESWFAGHVHRGKDLGIIEGTVEGSFEPERTVNLAEALKMILLANNVDVENVTVPYSPYAAVPPDAWFAPYFQYAKDKNLLDIRSFQNLYPGHALSRGELAEIMYRVAILEAYDLDVFSADYRSGGETPLDPSDPLIGPLPPDPVDPFNDDLPPIGPRFVAPNPIDSNLPDFSDPGEEPYVFPWNDDDFWDWGEYGDFDNWEDELFDWDDFFELNDDDFFFEP